MTPYFKTLPLLLVLAACGDGQPFFDDEVEEAEDALEEGEVADGVVPGDENGEEDDGFDTTGVLPPGTQNPSPDRSIIRFEGDDGEGGGLIRSVTYDAENETFIVDNLGFDGANVYSEDEVLRDNQDFEIAYTVYAADDVTEDSVTGRPINQVTPYRMIIGASETSVGDDPRTSFALVRTGGYAGHGFGGWVFQRQGGVELQTSGQATFDGPYAGVRTFTGRSGMELTSGDIEISIDFDDFNTNAAVKGVLENRQFYTLDGEGIALGGPGQTIAPDVLFTIQQGGTSITTNGEILGTLSNSSTITGSLEPFETGTYNGIIAGNMNDDGDGGEVTGIIILNSEDPRSDDVTVRETGGFIATR